ncbi:hypothetical protein H9P43_009333 [Blastocladiella emersonii ATCC 22665]|nr:hypothetical protein H9P43_009333 [Blastocladiella emersonii ATCC 22665]
MADAAAAPTESPALSPIQLLDPTHGWVIGTWVASVATLAMFAGAALLIARRYLRRPNTAFDTEAFLTARGTQPWVRIAWSFVAGSLGSWAIATPASMAASNGYIGLVSYAVSSGIPIVMLAFAGEHVQALLPRPLSLSDFVLWRYGRGAQVFVAGIVIINTAMGMISEFSTMGSIFAAFVKSTPYPIVALVGVTTLAYTAYGGLLISIVTDQLQGIFASSLLVLLAGYLAVSFPRSADLPPFPHETLGATSLGYSTLFTLPASMIASTFFSEGCWQRVWAAESRTALRKGALAGGFIISLAIALLGLTGLLSTWAYAPVIDYAGPSANLLTFYALGPNQYSWVGAAMVVLAVTMNMSAVDSSMNALAAVLSANLFRGRSLKFTRVLVLCSCIPLMVLGTYGLPTLSIFLVSNLLTTASVVPLLSGLVDKQRRYVSGYAMMFAMTAAAASLSVFGIVTQGATSALDGFVWAWWSNGYDIFAFVVPLVASIAFLALWVAVAEVLYRVAGVKGQGYTAEMRAVLESMEAAQAAADAVAAAGVAPKDKPEA